MLADEPQRAGGRVPGRAVLRSSCKDERSQAAGEGRQSQQSRASVSVHVLMLGAGRRRGKSDEAALRFTLTGDGRRPRETILAMDQVGHDPNARVPLRVTVRRDVLRGLKSGVLTFWMLARVMVPAYGAALILDHLGVIHALARVAGPVMRPLGLPGSATVPLVVGYIMNIYAAAGAMTALHLTGQQITVLALAILIGHNLIVEGAVLRKAGMSGTAFGVLRVVAGLAAAGLANLLMKAF
jgi:hypothetical protein